MTGANRWGLTAALLVLGLGWGITQPLAKIAVTGGYRNFGIIFWQVAISGALLGAICAVRGRGLRRDLPALRVYVVLALLGTLLPGAAGYEAARHLPAGWLAVVISTVPLVAFPIALALGNDRFSWLRLLGLLSGLAGVACLALPVQLWLTGAAAPDTLPPALLPWLGVALVAPALYALEGNYVASRGIAGLDPMQALLGASVVSALVAAPVALATGTWIDPRPPWGAPDGAVALSACVHALVYSGYVWLVGRAGVVFAAQVSYLVTGFGVLWSMALLGERYGAGFWLALALMFAGLFLVQPRRNAALADGAGTLHDGRRPAPASGPGEGQA